MTKNTDRILKTLSLLVSVVLLVLITVKLVDYFKEGKSSSRKLQQPIIENSNDIVWGSPNAPLNMYMFSSYKCKFCSLFFKEVFPKIKEKYIQKGKLRFVLKLIALREDKDMMQAIQASVCINKFGNFEKLHKLLITNNDVVYSPDFKILLDDVIASNTDIAQCMLEHNNYQYIKNNNAEFRNQNFSGTPTFVIGNKVYSGFRTFDQFQKIFQNKTSITTN